MLGIAIGFTVMVALVGLGLAGVFRAVPLLEAAMRAASFVYLLYLACKIAWAGVPSDGVEASGRPMTFLAAAAFQWVNPKAWAMALTAIAAYAPERTLHAVVLVAIVFGAINLPSVGVWAVIGQALRRFLSDPRRLHAFNVVMAVLLVISVVPVLR